MVVDRTKGELTTAEKYKKAEEAYEKLRKELGDKWCECDACQCWGQGACRDGFDPEEI